ALVAVAPVGVGPVLARDLVPAAAGVEPGVRAAGALGGALGVDGPGAEVEAGGLGPEGSREAQEANPDPQGGAEKRRAPALRGRLTQDTPPVRSSGGNSGEGLTQV